MIPESMEGSSLLERTLLWWVFISQILAVLVEDIIVLCCFPVSLTICARMLWLWTVIT